LKFIKKAYFWQTYFNGYKNQCLARRR
jgi:hypothetical protein